jgi:hypothetical protein
MQMEIEHMPGACGLRMRLKMPWWFWNLFGEQAVFLLSRRG